MTEKSNIYNKVVAVPETRQQDTLAQMLRNRGARPLEVPLVSIHDRPDPEPVLAWIRTFIASPPAWFILLTGEGLKRLLALADKHQLREDFVAVLATVATLSRGPKPERVLKELGFAASKLALAPTTAGVIATLQDMPIEGLVLDVQLYGDELNQPLTDYLTSRQVDVRLVSPYIYASKEEESKVAEFITLLSRGEVDVLAFTSQSQFHRLQQVARTHQLQDQLQQGLKRTILAAVGPVVKNELENAGYPVPIMPERVYFMMPLVAAIVDYFEQQ